MIDIESLRKLRREVGLTQAEVSIEVGVSQAYIARLENGTLDPKLSIVNKIMDVLNRRRKTKCSEIMTSNPVTIDARDSASIAVGLMQKHSYSQLPVLRAQQIVGIITERDIIRNLQHDMQTLSVQAVMSSECVPIVDENTSVDAVVPLFQNYQAIIIHNQGRIRGIITRSDLLKLT